jgi:hypothetical protein
MAFLLGEISQSLPAFCEIENGAGSFEMTTFF